MIQVVRPGRDAAKAIHCSTAQCEIHLGTIAMSVVERTARGVWRIQPGWIFRNGILERSDYDFRSERQLSHAFSGRERAPEGTQVVREVNLPIWVRCPQCHRLRIVTEDALFRPA